MAPKPSRDTLIHCDACGEDYSSTYRRCPFCGARNDPRRPAREDTYDDPYDTAPIPAPPPPRQSRQAEPEDNYVFDGQDAFEDDLEDEDYYTPRPKGGKRLAPKQGGGFDLPPINWSRLITFLCSLVIIVAALVIVFTYIYPKLSGNNEDPKTNASAGISDAPSLDPNTIPSQNVIPSTGPVGDSSQPVPESLPPVEPTVTGITLQSDGRTLSANDITLYVGESAQMSAVITPAGWSGAVTWTSSNPDWITVSDTGLVTNVNSTGSYHNAYITVTAGELTIRCEVRVRPAPRDTTPSQAPASQPPAIDPPASQPPDTSGNGPIVGQTGTIVGADGGLRVRGGPGTTYEVLATLNNDNTVTVVEDAGNGWYKITFPGIGETITGYIMGKYISAN